MLAQKEFQTIGEFYADIRARLELISKRQEIFKSMLIKSSNLQVHSPCATSRTQFALST